MTLDLRGYDAWKTSAPDPDDQPTGDDMQDMLTEERLKELDAWLKLATPAELRLAGQKLRSREEQLRRDAEATLAELNRKRSPRSDKGKPRQARAAAANTNASSDPDPFEVSR